MPVHIAEDRDTQFIDSWYACLHWAIRQIKLDPSRVVKIFRARAGQKLMRVVAEVTSEGIRLIPNGRLTRQKKV